MQKIMLTCFSIYRWILYGVRGVPLRFQGSFLFLSAKAKKNSGSWIRLSKYQVSGNLKYASNFPEISHWFVYKPQAISKKNCLGFEIDAAVENTWWSICVSSENSSPQREDLGFESIGISNSEQASNAPGQFHWCFPRIFLDGWLYKHCDFTLCPSSTAASI